MGLESRFWDKVDKDTTVGGCWEWTGSTTDQGYGNIWVDGKVEKAHRVAYALFEESPGEQLVLHHCDNKRCVNPGHLYLGDHSDNLNDAWERGLRGPPDLSEAPDPPTIRGEDRTDAKLTEADVREIKRRLDGDETHAEIAEDYPVKRTAISNISSGVTWKHV